MKRPVILGLTGSIGMGKSTTATMFADEGALVWDADAAVHALYATGGAAVPVIERLCGEAVVGGAVDRGRLKKWLAEQQDALSGLEEAIHPLVWAHRAGFMDAATKAGCALVVLDIPLLFETGADREVDATLVVTTPSEVQRMRVLARPSMDEQFFQQALLRQLSDQEKRARATYVIETNTLDQTRSEVRALIVKLRESYA